MAAHLILTAIGFVLGIGIHHLFFRPRHPRDHTAHQTRCGDFNLKPRTRPMAVRKEPKA